MTIDRLDEEIQLPLDMPAILSGDPKQLASYLRELVHEIQQFRMYDIHQRVNLLLDRTPGSDIYLGGKDATGDYPDGTWRIRTNDNGELSFEKKVAGTWTVVVVNDV